MLMKNMQDSKNKDNLADHMILSHLSSKRKDYDIEKFDNIFKKFDDDFGLSKKKQEKDKKNVSKSSSGANLKKIKFKKIVI